MKTVIMDHIRIERTLKRLAYQILENSYQEKSITLIGIQPRGVWVAQQLEQNLREIGNLEVVTGEVSEDALEDLESMKSDMKKRCVVLVDDVINSGRTMIQCAAEIMRYEPSLLFTACLVDRKHRKFPIQSDFTGLSLATTLQEHIQLVIEPSPTIYLE